MISQSAVCNIVICLNASSALFTWFIHRKEIKRVRKIGKQALEMRDRCAKAVWHLLSTEDKRKYKWRMDK